jgi:hypothetical protein
MHRMHRIGGALSCSPDLYCGLACPIIDSVSRVSHPVDLVHPVIFWCTPGRQLSHSLAHGKPKPGSLILF